MTSQVGLKNGFQVCLQREYRLSARSLSWSGVFPWCHGLRYWFPTMLCEWFVGVLLANMDAV